MDLGKNGETSGSIINAFTRRGTKTREDAKNPLRSSIQKVGFGSPKFGVVH